MVSLQARQSHVHAMVQNQFLVDVVRSAVQQFSQPSAAEDADYHPFAGCVSGAQSGAMGVHYVNGGLVGDGVVDEQHPEALVYEPKSDHLELVAVEFIVLASQWDAAHTDNLPPALRGTGVSIQQRPEPLSPAGVLRVARVGGAGQPERHVRRLESERVVQPVRAVGSIHARASCWVLRAKCGASCQVPGAQHSVTALSTGYPARTWHVAPGTAPST
jgi:hypothetical protein